MKNVTTFGAAIVLSLLLFAGGCGGASDARSGSTNVVPPYAGVSGSRYVGPPTSDEEMLRRFQEAASEGATWDNIGDRVGFSESQRAAYERGRQQGLRDIQDR